MNTLTRKRIGAIGGIAIMVPLPLIGVWIAGRLHASHLAFPPGAPTVVAAPFSLPVFIGLAAAIGACCLPFLWRIMFSTLERSPRPAGGAWPWWGWPAVVLTLVVWGVAWCDRPGLAAIRTQAFFPLWLGYIAVVSAWTCKRKGSCLLTRQPHRMLILFLVSAAFWWYFEYLNRFVQNWFYFGVDQFSAWRYFWFATLPFSTVLPAVMATDELLETIPRITAGLDKVYPVEIRCPRRAALLWFGCGTLSLLAIGLVPNFLFPMLWLSPLIIITAAQALCGQKTVFASLRHGNWGRLVRVALAALLCGFFWEMWNSNSLAGWIYSVPYVNRVKIFEMPLLGFAGYLPFGVECLIISELVLSREKRT